MSTQTFHPVQTLLRPGTLAQRLMGGLDRKDVLGMLLVIIMISLVGWLYLTQANATAAVNLAIEEHREQLKAVEAENARLSVEIAEWESLVRIEERARSLGFAPTTSALYLSVPGYSVREASVWEANLLELNP
jgi:cell division protein FtsL